MKKLAITVSSAALLLFSVQGSAGSSTNTRTSLNTCVNECLPSRCDQSVEFAQKCVSACSGHNTSITNHLLKKCTRSIKTTDAQMRKISNHQVTSTAGKTSTAGDHFKHSGQSRNQADITRELLNYNEPTWGGAADAPLSERTAAEAVPTSNPYGAYTTDTRDYGLTANGTFTAEGEVSSVQGMESYAAETYRG